MFPCSGCRRHLLEADLVCPFCATEQVTIAATAPGSARASVGAFVLAAATMLGANACAKDDVVPGADTHSSTSSEDSGTTTASETDESGSTEGDTNDFAGDSADTSLSFYAGPDYDMVSVSECDPFFQDCPEGEKCVPYGSTGGNWDANKCVPIMGDGQPGDPCTYGGVAQATDDCGEGSHCWDVMDVDGEPVGVCTAFCQGSADDPSCPDGSSCLIANEGSITLCIATCDPLLQACPSGLACYWASDEFLCIFTTQDIPEGEPCGFINDCIAGQSCTTAEVLPDCVGSACCAAYCDTEDPEACPNPELECVSFFEQGMAPPGYETVGVCILPGA